MDIQWKTKLINWSKENLNKFQTLSEIYSELVT